MESPYGYCQCGCGLKTTIAKQNHTQRRMVKGQPMPYINGHSKRGPRPTVPDGITGPDGAALVPLANGDFALVDEADYALVKTLAWTVNGHGYATTQMLRPDGTRGTVRMHRYILGLNKSDQVDVDHRNQNPLDNRRGNLRICSHADNMKNVSAHADSSSGLKGAHKSRNKWESRIRVNGKRVKLGRFDTAQEAHAAYVDAAERLHGEFANCG